MKTIRALRRERGWTQFDLALAVGVQPQTIYLWEKGQRLPRVPQLRKLGQIFEICSDDLALEPPADDSSEVVRRARTERYPGEKIPGRNPISRSESGDRGKTDTVRDDY